MRVASRAIKRLPTQDLRKLGNIRKLSKLHRIIAQCSVLLPKLKFCRYLYNSHENQKLNFPRSAAISHENQSLSQIFCEILWIYLLQRARFFGRAIVLAQPMGHAKNKNGRTKKVHIRSRNSLEILLFVFYYLNSSCSLHF